MSELFDDPATTLVKDSDINLESPDKAMIPAEAKQTVDVQQLMELAIEKNVDVASIERLAELAVKFEERESHKALNRAMHQFHRLCPVVAKSNPVYVKGGDLAYKFVSFDQLKVAIQPILEQCGLMFSHSVEEKRVVCRITHCDGAHSESSFPLAAWKGTGLNNEMQNTASAISYAKRYSLLGALGIATADDDAATVYQNPDENPNAPRAQPRGERVTRKEVVDCFELWKQSNGGNGAWTEFTEFARKLCKIDESANLNDFNVWTAEDLKQCDEKIEGKMSS